MGRLSGFRYRDVARRLRGFGFGFLRQAAGSHEIWFNPESRRYTTVPIPVTCRKGRSARFCGKPAFLPTIS